VVQIVHGMSEHAARYDGLAQALNAVGYAVYASDHRGHGKTAPSRDDLGYLGDEADWRTCLDDLGVVQARIVADYPGTPIVLLGHSMGAFLAQQFAGEHGASLAGLVLSGTYRESPLLARAGAMLARFERLRLGPRGRSRLINALTVGAFNRRFSPIRTAFDWLSRDEAVVNRYMADPLCGFPASVQLWIELLNALAEGLPMPPRIPVCVLLGERDSVCAADPTAQKLIASFINVGIDRLSQCVYPDARHELFHETNRDEVIHDLIGWLDQINCFPTGKRTCDRE
jgi:alpha-beta hydrolase superfamily lysophospholipase